MTDPKDSPKHGSSPTADPASDTQPHNSMSQADGTGANAPRGETQDSQPVKSQTPENRDGRLNPSAPNDATSKMPANTTRDAAGEVGEPSGEGTLDAPRAPESKKEKDSEAA